MAARAFTRRLPGRLVGERRGEDRALGHGVAGELCDQAAATHDEHAMREPEDLSSSEEIRMTPRPSAARLAMKS